MREELPNATATPLVMSNVFDELGRLCWQAGTTTAATCDSAPVSSAAVPVRALRYDLAGNVVGINSPAGDLSIEYDDRGLLVSSSNPGAYLGTTTTGGVADNPVRVEAESAAASGVVNGEQQHAGGAGGGVE